MTQTQVWTIGRLLEWTTEYLRKNGSDSPRLEAEVLLAHARNSPRIHLYTSFNDEPSEAERTTFREMVRRRAEGTPVAYLVGHKEFFSIDFVVTPDCLIPRPETEHLVVAAIDWAKERIKAMGINARHLRIADIGTGSGCVAVAVAKQLPKCEVSATDISPKALAIAKLNIANHGLEDRIQLWEGDLLDAIPSEMENLDIILSNPPYVSEAEFKELPKDVREQEPALALVSGPTGMEVTERLLVQAATRLQEGGVVMIESSPMLIPRIGQHLRTLGQWALKPIVKDLQGHARIIIAERIR